MTLKAHIASIFRRKPLTAEDLEARQEALRLRDEQETIRVSQRSGAGENYQSGRR
jgi:hypothetical protein